MIKKYLPFILLIAAAFFLYWIKTHQRGPSVEKNDSEPFKRDITNISYSKHARCRMGCRYIDEEEVKEILKKGIVNYSRIEEDEKGKTYPLEGVTRDQQHVRIVVAPHENELVIVTVIDLGKEWECDCR